MQRSQGSHLAKAFVHRTGWIQWDSFLPITFFVSDVLRCMFEFLIGLLKDWSLYLCKTGLLKKASAHIFIFETLQLFFQQRCQVKSGHGSRWLKWGHYVVIRVIWNQRGTAGFGGERCHTSCRTVFVFIVLSFFFQGNRVSPGLNFFPTKHEMHVIFKKKEISKIWHFRLALSCTLPTVLEQSLAEGFFS